MTWGAIGLIAGISFAGSLLFSFWTTSVALACATPAVVGAAFGSVFSIAGALAHRFGYGRGAASCLLAIIWVMLSTLLDELGVVYLPISASLLELSPRIALASRIVGIPGLDGLVILANAGIVGLLDRRWRLLTAVLISWLALSAAAQLVSTNEVGTSPVAALQPVIRNEDFRASGSSLASRAMILRRLELLTIEAASEAVPQLIIWPEGGSGFPDLQLPGVRRTLAQALSPGKSQVLAATTLVGDRGRYNGAGLVSERAVEGISLKAHLAPFAESSLRAGETKVLESRFGRFAPLICFDALFGQTVRQAAREGAEFLVLTTDDASFQHSSAVYGHALTARLQAFAVGLPLVIASNQGPSSVSKASGRVVAQQGYGQRGLLRGQIERIASTAPIVLPWLRILVRLLSLAAVFSMLISPMGAPRSFPLARHDRFIAVALAPLALGLSLGFEYGVMHWRNADPSTQFRTQLHFGASPPLQDGLGPAFKQGTTKTCGAAALALALTALGETTTEEGLRKRCQLRVEATSLAHLADCANEFGFIAEGFDANWSWLATTRDAVTILHYSDQHFVAVIHVLDDQAVVFDPSVGRVELAGRSRIEQAWSGKALRIGYRGPHQL